MVYKNLTKKEKIEVIIGVIKKLAPAFIMGAVILILGKIMVMSKLYYFFGGMITMAFFSNKKE